jgi:hypothetical protein
MTRAPDHRGVRKEPVPRAGNSEIRIVTRVESDALTIVVEVRHSTGSGARIDLDHDHLLREFMEGSDE